MERERGGSVRRGYVGWRVGGEGMGGSKKTMGESRRRDVITYVTSFTVMVSMGLSMGW